MFHRVGCHAVEREMEEGTDAPLLPSPRDIEGVRRTARARLVLNTCC